MSEARIWTAFALAGFIGLSRGKERKSLLFLKKKKQKDFYSGRRGKIPAMAWNLGGAET
jgi:hypothetical protein